MKRCPECRRDFYDDSLIFCLDAGTRLLDGPVSVDEPATASPAEATTRARIDLTNPSAIVSWADSTSKNFNRRLSIIPNDIDG